MLRLQAEAALPARVRRDAWHPLVVCVRNESNGVPALPADARLQLAVTLLRDERRAVTGAPVGAKFMKLPVPMFATVAVTPRYCER